MKDNLRKVFICSSTGMIRERTQLRVNQKSFHPGQQFQAMRNKVNLTVLKLRFLKEEDGVIHAA